MSSQMGRPPKNEKARTKTINIRLTEEEKENIRYCADKLDMSRTDAIVYGIGLVKEKIENKNK